MPDGGILINWWIDSFEDYIYEGQWGDWHETSTSIEIPDSMSLLGNPVNVSWEWIIGVGYRMEFEVSLDGTWELFCKFSVGWWEESGWEGTSYRDIMATAISLETYDSIDGFRFRAGVNDGGWGEEWVVSGGGEVNVICSGTKIGDAIQI